MADRSPQIPIQLASNQLSNDEVFIEFLGHSMYRLTTHNGINVVTDYSGGVRPIPDVVTMNHAHSSHYTSFPEKEIKYVLEGWGQNGVPAKYNLDLSDILIRNVTTDIRSQFTGFEPDGNSIFIFEAAGLCIGHFGHLHHEPTDEQYALMGRLDVVMAAVDGGLTIDLPSMIKIMDRVRASVVLPMHWRGSGSLDRFLLGMKNDFVIERRTENALVLSLDLLPRRPTVIVLPPKFEPDDYE